MLRGRRIALPAAAVAALVAGGCGGGGGHAASTQDGGQGSGGAGQGSAGAPPGSSGGQNGSATTPGRRLRPAGPTATRVIRGWSDALRRGDVDRATDYFGLPSIVQNNSPPVTIDERAEARAFNLSLPCGAQLERAYRIGRYTAAVFRLTDRPGADCGTGTGNEAATAFVIRKGKIREWRRLQDPVAGGEAPPELSPPAQGSGPEVTGPRA
jgi:hypothetical protein